MAKGLVTITFAYEMDEDDESDISEQIETDRDDLRQMVNKYFLDIRHKPEDLDIDIQIG